LKIVLDAMGGDLGPEATVLGLLEALPLLKSEVILVGREEEIRKFLPSGPPAKVTLVHADEVVTMEDKPIEALRK
jgi:phosphate acyltransferase